MNWFNNQSLQNERKMFLRITLDKIPVEYLDDVFDIMGVSPY
jgi:hypothetical protein